jgi:hypothetical protein
VSAWEAPGATDEWYTPKSVFDALGCAFDLDVAAPEAGPLHVPAREWFFHDSLNEPWFGFVWGNFPFGGRNGLVPWLEKFFAHGDGIALTPDRTSAPWFQTYAPKADAILFTRKIRFLRPDGTEGKSPSTGTALMAAGPRGLDGLARAADAGFGMLVLPRQLRPLQGVLHGKQGFFNPSTLDEADQHARPGNPDGLRVADAGGAIVFNHDGLTSPGSNQ